MKSSSQLHKIKSTPKGIFTSLTLKSFLLFLIWPFGALISALAQYRKPMAKTVVWLFCVYFGFSMVIPENIEGAGDAARYAYKLEVMYNQVPTFNYLISMIYNPDDGFVDIYQPLATWLIAFFTDDPRWLFALFGGVFGFFYVKNLWIIFDKIDIRLRSSLLMVLFMLTFALINPIWNINGVRMWTAAQVFVYGVLSYFINKDKKGIIWIASSFLFHFSFLFPTSVFILFLVIPKRLNLVFFFYIIASFVSEIDTAFIRSELSILPQVFQTRVEGYTNETYIETIKENTNLTLLQILSASFMKILTYGWIIILYLSRKKWNIKTPSVTRLFKFSLFFGGFAQLAGSVASGGRFMTIANMLFFAVFIVVIFQNNFKHFFQTQKIVSVPMLFFIVIFSIRIGFEMMGLLVLFGNPFLALFIKDTFPMMKLITQIFN